MKDEAVEQQLAQLRKETERLSGETFALQAILVQLAGIAASRDPVIRANIAAAFDEAASFAERLTIQAGRSVSPHHLAHSLRIIEELRAATLGNHEKPKDGV